jgi:hypothetical protein
MTQSPANFFLTVQIPARQAMLEEKYTRRQISMVIIHT